MSEFSDIENVVRKMRDDAEARAKSHIKNDEPGRHIEANIMKNEMNELLSFIEEKRGATRN